MTSQPAGELGPPALLFSNVLPFSFLGSVDGLSQGAGKEQEPVWVLEAGQHEPAVLESGAGHPRALLAPRADPPYQVDRLHPKAVCGCWWDRCAQVWRSEGRSGVCTYRPPLPLPPEPAGRTRGRGPAPRRDPAWSVTVEAAPVKPETAVSAGVSVLGRTDAGRSLLRGHLCDG